MNIHPLVKAIAIAGFSSSILVVPIANAAHTELAVPAIVESATLPADMAEWMANGGTDFSWNPVNARLGHHPDRIDPNGSAGTEPGVIYIFKDATAANAWWDPTNPATPNPPAGIPDAAVAYVHWKLDNNSGEFPGIMSKTDDMSFKTNNCIMASGTTIPEGGGQDKTCSNPQGSSKRLKLVVLKADEPIDMMFNTTMADLTYAHYDQSDVQDDIFRIYRYIMKFGNGTGTDTTAPDGEVRDGTRLVGFKLQLGTGGVGTSFTQSSDIASDGIGYELRLCINDRYFDEQSGQTTPGISDCPAGETEVWLENEYATFSPSMYSLTTDKRSAPVGGFWDKNPAGVFAPQVQQENEIDSGSGAYVANVASDGSPYDAFPAAGQIGQTTSNYYDVVASQGAGAGVGFPDNMFGYQMFYGVFKDGDSGNISSGIYIDDDGDPATEGGLHAWWDGSSPSCCYRWGIDRDRDGVPGPDAFGLVSDADLVEMAARPLDEHQVLDPPRYEVGYMDDLGGLNSDTFVKLNKDFSGTSFTIRMIAQSTADAGLAATDIGVADGPWVANPPVEITDYVDTDGDGTLDPVDDFPDDPTEDTDTDGDGTGDNADTDDDGDGVPDVDDAFPVDPAEDTDTDSDSIGDNADTDDDNDGVLDQDDAYPLDSTASVAPTSTSSGLFGFHWITAGLMGLALLLRRRRL